MPVNEKTEMFEPVAVYKRTDSNGLDYWTTKEALNVESELKKIEHLKKFGKAAYEAAAAAITDHAESQETAHGLRDLKKMTEFVDYYGPLVSQTKDAQKELTMRLLLDGEPLDDVKDALGTSTPWLTIQAWAGKFTGVGGAKNFVNWVVPARLGKAIDEKVEEIAAKNREAKEKAEAKKAAKEKVA